MKAVEANIAFQSYRDLLVWQTAVELAVACYEVTQTFPKAEIYGMTSQIRRATTAVAANIAEGYGRDSAGGYAQFLRIAQGSLKELETHITIAGRVALLGTEDARQILDQADQIGKMLRSLIRKIQSQT